MWATLQDQSFLLGAVLVTLVHATKFGELNLANPVTGRYLALLPGAKVRDFVGPYAYHLALVAFLSVSLIAYYLVCQISPDILKGAIKLFTDADPETAIRGVPYPLYVAGLFIGLTQPVIPVFSRFGEAQRDFFHDQIEVPKRLIDLAERLAGDIEARAGADKRLLAREVRNLVSGDVLSTVQTYGDLAFYKLQLERLDLDDPAALENAIKESSAKELRRLIERITFCTLVAVMRQSGTQALVKVADAIGISSSRPRFNNLGYFLTGLAASGMLFLHLHLDRRARFRVACRPDCAPVRQAARSEPLAQRSRQRWQRTLDNRSANLRLSDDGRQLAGAKRSEADAEPKAIPVRHIERRPDRVLSIRCFPIRSMHWRHHCVQECGIALRVWEHLQRVERGPVGCQIDAADDTVIHSGCSLPIHHMVSCILQRRDFAARPLLHENTARNCRRGRFSRGAVRHDLFIRIPARTSATGPRLGASAVQRRCQRVDFHLRVRIGRIILQEPNSPSRTRRRASAYPSVHGQWNRVAEAEYQSSATLVAYKRAVQGRTANGRDSRPGT